MCRTWQMLRVVFSLFFPEPLFFFFFLSFHSLFERTRVFFPHIRCNLKPELIYISHRGWPHEYVHRRVHSLQTHKHTRFPSKCHLRPSCTKIVRTKKNESDRYYSIILAAIDDTIKINKTNLWTKINRIRILCFRVCT